MSGPEVSVPDFRLRGVSGVALRHYRSKNPALPEPHADVWEETIEEPCSFDHLPEHSSAVLPLSIRTAHSRSACALIRL